MHDLHRQLRTPLSDEVSNSIKANDLAVAAIASSNRNFEGRIHPLVKANYLASPPLVVAMLWKNIIYSRNLQLEKDMQMLCLCH